MKRLIALVILSLCTIANARDESGRLDIILSPNLGKPAVVREGDTLTLQLRSQAEVSAAQGDRRLTLAIDWKTERGISVGTARWPAGFAPGPVTLEARTQGGMDQETRAVYVLGEPQSTYLAAVAGPVALDAADPTTAEALGALIETLNDSPAAFAVFTGPLTANGATEEFQALVAALQSATRPVFLACGPADAARYSEYFGDAVFGFQYEDDGFMVVDASQPIPMWDPAGQAGALQRLRRQMKPRRWSIGFGYQYALEIDMRAQLTLFVDDPLDYYFISTAEDVASDDGGTATPWATTPLAVAPALATGNVLLFQVRPGAVAPLAPQTISSLE